MKARLTPHELAMLVASAQMDDDGLLSIEIPDAAVESSRPRIVLAHPRIVRYGDRHAQLTDTQYAVVRYLIANGPADIDDLRAGVWLGGGPGEKRIRNLPSEISSALADADIPWEVSGEGSVFSFRSIDNPGNPGQIRDGD